MPASHALTSARFTGALLGLFLLVALPGATTTAHAATPEDDSIFDLGHLAHPISGNWNEGIFATTFAEKGSSERSGLGFTLDGEHDLFCALPAVRDTMSCLSGHLMKRNRHDGTLTFRVIEIRPHGQNGPVIEATVQDIGPWCINDPYWVDTSRPIAESGHDLRGRTTNRAGIDLSPALLRALGMRESGKVDWRFKVGPDGEIVTLTRKA